MTSTNNSTHERHRRSNSVTEKEKTAIAVGENPVARPKAKRSPA
ncbi:hypothetical protein [Altericista sp. CCNU0014]